MSREIPITLQSHLEGPAQTTCLLLKIICTDGTGFYFTDHDREVRYDDGDGEQVYQQRAGFEMSQVEATLENGVDNAEASQLIPVFDLPDDVTEADINGGRLDYAQFWVWLVNYDDTEAEGSPPARKHVEVMSGTTGQARMDRGQLLFNELRSLSQQMHQTIVDLTSLTCRTFLGSDICGVDTDPLWQDFEITAVGAENDRTFTITGASGDFNPGLCQFYTGDNAPRSFQVESNAGAVVTLSEPLKYPAQVGDTGRIRIDCRKRFLEDCIGVFDNGLNFDGEPNLPIADEEAINAGDL